MITPFVSLLWLVWGNILSLRYWQRLTVMQMTRNWTFTFKNGRQFSIPYKVTCLYIGLEKGREVWRNPLPAYQSLIQQGFERIAQFDQEQQ